MRLELKRHIDHDRLGKLEEALRRRGGDGDEDARRDLPDAAKRLPLRLKLLALILTTHAFKLKTKTLCHDFVHTTYRRRGHDDHDDDRDNDVINDATEGRAATDPPQTVWCLRTAALLNERLGLLEHARWLARRRYQSSFFVGLEPVSVYDALYDYMVADVTRYPAFGSFHADADRRSLAMNVCTAMTFLLVMSAYDQEHLDLYLKVFLAVEWPGQWAKTIFVWRSNSNAGKSYLFDSIIKRACANSTCINDPKGGKDNAPEKAEYVRNFVLFAHEFSQANSNELKKLVSDSTFKFRMNYGNVMNEAYTTGKIMFNCNKLPPTSDEAAINRLTLFNMPFWFSRRQRVSDSMLNWTRAQGSGERSRWEIACRYLLPELLRADEKKFFNDHGETKNEIDLFDGYAALRPSILAGDFGKTTSSPFLVQNKTSMAYIISSPPTDRIVHGLVNITTHFSWLRHFKRLDMPVDFSTLPATSEAVRSEWLRMTLPYQEWKLATGARIDPTGRVPMEAINRSLSLFAAKKNVDHFAIRQFFETDFASAREATRNEYYIQFDAKAFCE